MDIPPPELLSALDEGIIAWSHPRHAFKVFRVVKALARRPYKVFIVERRDRAGVLLSTTAMKLETRRVLCLARMYWNVADESEAARYTQDSLDPIAQD